MENFNPTNPYDIDSVMQEIDRLFPNRNRRFRAIDEILQRKGIQRAINAAKTIQSIYRGQQVRNEINDREFKRGLFELLKLDVLDQDVIEKIHNQGVSTKGKTSLDGGKRKSFKRRNRNKNRRRSIRRSNKRINKNNSD